MQALSSFFVFMFRIDFMATDTLVLETLFYPFAQDIVQQDVLGEQPVFLNAQVHPFLNDIRPACYQTFKPYADGLTAYHCVSNIDEITAASSVFLLLPKNQIEALGLIAHALKLLNGSGVLICAADNKAGGARLGKTLKSFGLQDFQLESKNKARVAVVDLSKESPDLDAINQALAKLTPQRIAEDRFWSVPGLYGWDKIDKGSVLLVDTLPQCLSGHVADFGCGYGFLSDAILRMPNVETLTCIDADARALEMCKRNLECFESVEYFWEDLSQPIFENRFDTIVMNPPFHEGKSTKNSLGQNFIRTAAAALKPSGILWMVANAHLPYEDILVEDFSNVEKVTEEQGFKIYKAHA